MSIYLLSTFSGLNHWTNDIEIWRNKATFYLWQRRKQNLAIIKKQISTKVIKQEFRQVHAVSSEARLFIRLNARFITL